MMSAGFDKGLGVPGGTVLARRITAFRFLCVLFVAVVAVGVAVTPSAAMAWAGGETRSHSGNVGILAPDAGGYRLHFIAHSNDESEQWLKAKVRDAFLAMMLGDTVGLRAAQTDGSDPLDTGHWVLTHEQALIDRGEQLLRQYGSPHRVTIEVGPSYFADQALGDTVVPAGVYNAIRVMIGDAQGDNWWCVLFPPLCFIDEGEAVGMVDEDTFGLLGGPDALGQQGITEPSPATRPVLQPTIADDAAPLQIEFRMWSLIAESNYAVRVRDWLETAFRE